MYDERLFFNDVVVGYCLQCGEPVFEYEDCFVLDGEYLHDECKADWISDNIISVTAERRY